jgi:hypothetical protein
VQSLYGVIMRSMTPPDGGGGLLKPAAEFAPREYMNSNLRPPDSPHATAAAAVSNRVIAIAACQLKLLESDFKFLLSVCAPPSSSGCKCFIIQQC